MDNIAWLEQKIPDIKERVFYLNLLRVLLPKFFPDIVKEKGLEMAEEWALELVREKKLTIGCDKTKQYFWLEKIN